MEQYSCYLTGTPHELLASERIHFCATILYNDVKRILIIYYKTFESF